MTLPPPCPRNADALIRILVCLIIVFFHSCFAMQIAHAESAETEPWYEGIDADWGGHFRLRGSASWPDDDSFYGPVGTGTYYDGSTEFRLKNTLFLKDWAYIETHYEAILSGGDTRRKTNQLRALFPALFAGRTSPGQPLEDDRRLLDLTTTISDDDSYVLYHRLDRLSLTLLPEWGVVRIGRQAITWGNGLLFNPMDLFNPFAPTDIERDYKIGDDMVTVQFPFGRVGELQVLYVPRRDPIDHDVEWDESSLAGKLHVAAGTTEFDFMLGRHYDDYVVGLGSMGYLGDAAWRADATWTFLEDGARRDGYLSFVANLDYSWVWNRKNFYGLVEFYFNGLGENDPVDAFTNPDVIERLDRGELFTLGRAYLSGTIQMEVTPLLNAYVSVINNVNDPSGVIQPRIAWDFAQNFQLIAGANIAYGKEDTEFGGFKIPGTDFLYKSSNGVFVWVTYFF